MILKTSVENYDIANIFASSLSRQYSRGNFFSVKFLLAVAMVVFKVKIGENGRKLARVVDPGY
jgi:hypothetical protein